MALSTPRIIGRDIAVTCATAKTIWNEVAVNFGGSEEEATASDSTLDEGVFTVKILTLRLTGFLGSVNNGTTLPARGDTISDLAIKVSADNVLPSVAAYTNLKVLTCNFDFRRGPSTFEFTARSGMLN